MMYFECKIKFEKTMENGMVKNTTEAYLVEAESFADAEKRVFDETAPFANGDCEVSAVNRRHFVEVFKTEAAEADKWYKAKLNFITLDEKTGTEKHTSQLMLVQASGFHHALERLDEGMKGSMMDYTIVSLTETPYMDYFEMEATATSEDKAL